LETPISYAYAVKAGPWVFLTGHEAYAWVTGIPDEVIGPPGFPLYGRDRSRREGDFILQRMGRVLGEFGSDLAHSVRLDQYYPNPKAVAAYHLSRHAEFHDYIPPSTSVVMERCFAAPATISTSLIAVMPEAGYEIRKVHPPGVASAPTSGFVPAVVCDEFVFVLTCKDAVRFALFETGGDSAHVHPYPEPKAARIDGPRAHRRTRMRS
jgi:hypothetical protein